MKSEVLLFGVAMLVTAFCGCSPKELKKQVQQAQQVVEAAKSAMVDQIVYPEWEEKLKGKIAASQEEASKRTNWHRANIVGAYKKHGRRNPKWNKDVSALMERWIPIVMTPDFSATKGMMELGQSAKELIDRGCDDPIVGYIRARYLGFDPGLSKQELAREWKQVAARVKDSDYPPVRKFWPYIRAAAMTAQVRPTEEVAQYYELSLACVGEMARDPETPEIELYVVGSTWHFAHRNHVPSNIESWSIVNEQMSTGNEPNFAQNVLKGQVFTDYAWEARGNDWGHRVSEQGWKGFHERLSEAEKALVTAWYQRPDDWRAPTFMITVELGQGRGRKRMEKWFNRAMKAEPSNNNAVNSKLYYLEPKWHGSQGEMLKFGRECLESTNWTGSTTLFIADAHYNIAGFPGNERAKYYLKPVVWKDVSAAFEKYLKRYPEDHNRRTRLAKWAVDCNQPEIAGQILNELGTNAVKSIFGTDREFEREVAWLKMKARTKE